MLQRDHEVVMFLKTTAAQAEAAREELILAHPYDIPCVLALDIRSEGSNPAFLAWIGAETAS